MNLKVVLLHLYVNRIKDTKLISIHLIILQDIGTVYQIFADEVLGSGQFGVVYGGAYVSRMVILSG